VINELVDHDLGQQPWSGNALFNREHRKFGNYAFVLFLGFIRNGNVFGTYNTLDKEFGWDKLQLVCYFLTNIKFSGAP
jgi:hypothetical protein